MRLTQYHRNIMISSIMKDIPQPKLQEELESLVTNHLRKVLPQEVLPLLNSPSLRVLLSGNYCVQCNSSSIFYGRDYTLTPPRTPIPLTLEEIDGGSALKHKVQVNASKLKGVREKIAAALNSCNTTNQVKETYPEFTKYLPKEIVSKSSDRSLPVVQGLDKELTALGWPAAE